MKKSKNFTNRNITVLEKSYLDSILARPQVETVFITTQFKYHYELVKKALHAGKHVFVEKPFVETKEQEQELINLAKENGLVLVVGYAYMNEHDFFKLRRLMQKGFFGEVKRVELTMLNPVAGRKLDYSSNVIEDLAAHQLSMLHMMFGEQPTEIKAISVVGEEFKINLTYGDVGVYIHLDRDFKEE